MRGLILAAPASGAGKTTVTLGLLRLLARQGHDVRSAKAGPDYIDPRFHAAATGAPCPNLDAWAMSPGRLRAIAAGAGGDVLVIEGAMGLFDGAPPDNAGSTAALARHLGLPVILVVDAARMSGSVAPLVAGFAAHDPDVPIAGVILNNVGSPRHERLLRRALDGRMPVLGALPRRADLHHPSRHLGLVQAGERADLDAFLDIAADLVAAHVPLGPLLDSAAPLNRGRRTDRRGACRRRHSGSRWPRTPPSALPIRTCWPTGAPRAPKSGPFRRWPTRRCRRPTSSSCRAAIPNCMRPRCRPPTRSCPL